MKPDLQEAIDYFTQQKDYFWRWADDGQVIEWQNGITICYRDELVELLRQLEGQRVVPFSSIVLFIAACSDSYKTSGGIDILENLVDKLAYRGKKETEVLLHQSLDFMDALAGLPKDVKNSVVKKAHIIHEVFQQQNSLSNLTWLFLADELDSGRIDTTKETALVTFLLNKFNNELSFLSAAGLMYPTTERLVVKVLTGLPEIPKPIETGIPEPSNKDLLGQLAEDPKTSGISYLTKHLIAALNIPMQSQGSGDQPLGGISDITNKGSYDRLLLSELAQDEELLTARLVNSEALYFRREEPPEDVNRKRVLLLDATLKMWGMPRVFGISAALACTLNTKHGEAIEAYALSGDDYTSIDLASSDGILNSLQQLNPALHCGGALDALLTEQGKTGSDEYIFITGDWQHQPFDFQKILAKVKPELNFIISVGRTGDLQLYECINGNAKLLSTTKFDLDEIFFQKAQTKQKSKIKKQPLDTRLAFLNQEESPIYFPTPQSLQLTTERAFFNHLAYKDDHVVAIYDDQRLLFWKNWGKGAIEALGQIELGVYYFGAINDANSIYILIIQQEKGTLILYTLNTDLVEVKRASFTNISCSSDAVAFEEGCFKILNGKNQIEINCRTETITPAAKVSKSLLNSGVTVFEKLDSYARRMVHNGYNTLNRFEDVFLKENSHGRWEIGLDRRTLIVSDHLIFSEPTKHITNTENNTHLIKANASEGLFWVEEKSNIKFKQFIWDDGSQVIVDSRGLVHLISSDEGLPQVTIVLITNKTTACWASDGKMCGFEYFLPTNNNVIPVLNFYEAYINPYINRIVEICS